MNKDKRLLVFLLLIKPPDSLGVQKSFSGVFLTKKSPSGRIKVQSVNCTQTPEGGPYAGHP